MGIYTHALVLINGETDELALLYRAVELAET